jgi:hypothetical protein
VAMGGLVEASHFLAELMMAHSKKTFILVTRVGPKKKKE